MIKTTIVKGKDAQILLANNKFIQRWKQLEVDTPGFTRLQAFEFVHSWYIFHTQYEPVLSIAYNQEGELVGLMSLAWHTDNQFITHAGAYDAEYHGWLARPDFTAVFIRDTLQLIKSQFSIKKWKWRWIPPGLSSPYFEELTVKGVAVAIENRPSLIWDLTNPDKLQSFKKNRSIRSKFNRYKKRGNYRFEVITDVERTAAVMKIASIQCDIRQEAINNVRPFAINPNKIAFCSALQSHPGLVHVSALWLDEQLLAFHYGIIDDKRVCLGISSYDPSESKQSPGTLILIELAKSLTADGFEILDLTPGTDAYKKRYSNQEQPLSRPTVTFSKPVEYLEKIKHTSRDRFIKLLPLFKTDIFAITNQVARIHDFFGQLKTLGVASILKQIAKSLFNKKTVFIYFLKTTNNIGNDICDSTVGIQRYEDLDKYLAQEPFPNKQMLFRNSLDKFSKGETLLSAIETDQLNWMAWLSDGHKPVQLSTIPVALSLEEGGYILYDFYYRSAKENTSEFYSLLKDTLRHLKPTNFPGLHICLQDSLQLSEAQISELGIASVAQVTYIQFAYFFKKHYLRDIQPTTSRLNLSPA